VVKAAVAPPLDPASTTPGRAPLAQGPHEGPRANASRAP